MVTNPPGGTVIGYDVCGETTTEGDASGVAALPADPGFALPVDPGLALAITVLAVDDPPADPAPPEPHCPPAPPPPPLATPELILPAGPPLPPPPPGWPDDRTPPAPPAAVPDGEGAGIMFPGDPKLGGAGDATGLPKAPPVPAVRMTSGVPGFLDPPLPPPPPLPANPPGPPAPGFPGTEAFIFLPFPLWSYQVRINPVLEPTKLLSAMVSKKPNEVNPISCNA